MTPSTNITRLGSFTLATALAIGCGGGVAGPGPGGSGGGSTTSSSSSSSGIICCDAACVSTLGSFTFQSLGQNTIASGSLTISDNATGTVLLEQALDGHANLGGHFIDGNDLAAYEDGTIELRVQVKAYGYADFDQTFDLPVTRSEICCDSCLSATGDEVIELGAPTGAFLNGCLSGGGDPQCPMAIPSDGGSCTNAGACCNYESNNGDIGCICNAGTWSCETNICACI
jgi:hypothetical protein